VSGYPQDTAKKLPTIMLVDDQADWLAINKRNLLRAGYYCDTFASSTEAIDAYRKSPVAYRIVVLDINLGAQANGLSVAKSIFEINPKASVIFISTQSQLQRYQAEFENIMKVHGLKYYPKGGDQSDGIVDIVRQYEVYRPEDFEHTVEGNGVPGGLVLWELSKAEDNSSEQ